MNSNVAVDGNINMDFVFEVNNFSKPGETMRSYNFKRYSGGKGENQALTASTLGAGVLMYGLLGNDKYAKELTNILEKTKVNMKSVEVRECSTSLAFSSIDKEGENQIILVPGANSFIDCHYIDKIFKDIIKSDMLLLELEIPLNAIKYCSNKFLIKVQ